MSLPRWGGDRLLSLCSQEDLGSNPAPAMTGCVTLTLSILLCQREIKKKRPRQPGAWLEKPCEGSATASHKQETVYGFAPAPPLSSHAPVCPLPRTSRAEMHSMCVRDAHRALPSRGEPDSRRTRVKFPRKPVTQKDPTSR